MGFLRHFSLPGAKVWNAWTDIKEGAKMGYNAVKFPLRKIQGGMDWVNDTLAHATGIPIIDDAASLLKDNVVWSELYGAVSSANSTLDDIGKIGHDVSLLIDKGLETVWHRPEALTQPNFHSPGYTHQGTASQTGGVPIAPPRDIRNVQLIGATQTPSGSIQMGGGSTAVM